MIHGITAQARGALGGTGGDPNEILYADFMAGVYRLNGENALVSELFTGIDEVADLDPSTGLIMRYSWNFAFGSYPRASPALRAAIKSQIPDGVSIDVEWWQNGDYGGPVPFVIFSETGDKTTDTEYAQLWFGDNRVTLYDNKSLFFQYNLGNNPRYPSRGAATVNHRIDASTWQHAVATNGSTVLGALNYFRDTNYDIFAGWDVTSIPFFHNVSSGSLEYSAEGVIKSIRITKPVDFATLESRAVQPAVPTLGQLTVPAANVALLLSFEGAQGDITSTDRSIYANTLTFSGVTKPFIDEVQKAIGGSSYRQHSTVQAIVCDMDPALDLFIGPEPFSIDFFARIESGITGYRAICGIYDAFISPNTYGSWKLDVGTGGIRLTWDVDGIIGSPSTFTVPMTNATEEWIHFAFSMNEYGRVRIHRNGVLFYMGTSRVNAASIPVANKFYVGHSYVNSSGGATTTQWRGWIDEFRLVIGANPFDFDGNFVVPTAAYPNPV
jgi:hypothetical protein